MFGNINHEQKRKEQPSGKNGQAENSLDPLQSQSQPAGNENANVNMYTQMLRNANAETGNDFLSGLIEEGLDLAEGDRNDKEKPDNDGNIPEDIKDVQKEKINKIISNIIKDDSSGIGEEKPNRSSEDAKDIPEKNINNNIAPKDKEEKKDSENEQKASEAAKEPVKVLQKAAEDIFPDQMPEIEDFYKDPESDQQEDGFDDILNTFMIVHRPKTRNLKKKKKTWKKPPLRWRGSKVWTLPYRNFRQGKKRAGGAVFWPVLRGMQARLSEKL